MRLKRFIIILLGVLGAYSSFAQMRGELVQSRILILLDESSSMIQPWASGKEKYKAAHEIIMRLMDSVYAVNNQVEFSLRVFGHQHPVSENDCYDTKNEVAFSKDNRSQMAARLDDIHPLGVTPIAFALTEAAEKDIVDENHNAYSIILITDGGESCGGDICEVMKKLIRYKVYFKPYIVSLENDPSLRTTYACMGDFLQVTKEKDIPKAVSAIVESFRPVIKLNAEEYKQMQNIAANAPSVLGVNKPTIKTDTAIRKKDDISPVAISSPVFMKEMPVVVTWRQDEKTVEIPPANVDTHTAAKIAAITPVHSIPFKIDPPVSKKIALVKEYLQLPEIVIDTPARQPVTDKIEKLRPLRPRQFNVIFVIEDHTYAIRQVPPLPAVKGDSAGAQQVAEKKHDFKVETTDDKETTVSVFFTNGMGKYYTTSPQVVLLDPITKKAVRKFFRTVDPGGNPDPQTEIPAGVYNLTLASRPDYILPGVKIEANKNNKVIVTVKNTSLSFVYANAPDRPVKEFYAVVTERDKAQGRVQEQKCTEALQYEPGNYHIEINTFPKDIRNVDLDFDGETVITVPQPGFAKFTGDGKTHSVTLYQRLGDKFLSFYTLDLGDPRSQHLQIQPGEYQVHYQKGPGQGFAAEQVQLFRIKPAQETEIILK